MPKGLGESLEGTGYLKDVKVLAHNIKGKVDIIKGGLPFEPLVNLSLPKSGTHRRFMPPLRSNMTYTVPPKIYLPKNSLNLIKL